MLKVCQSVCHSFLHVLWGIALTTTSALSGLPDETSDETERSSNLAFDLLCCSDDTIEESEVEINCDLLDPVENEKLQRRYKKSVAKRKRMSLWASSTARQSMGSLSTKRQPLFRHHQSLCPIGEKLQTRLHEEPSFPNSTIIEQLCDVEAVTAPEDCLSHDELLSSILAFLTDGELTHSASLVSRMWSDTVTAINVKRLLSMIPHDDESDEISVDINKGTYDWSWLDLNNMFPWACFLSEGSFKKVFKVHNSTMDEVEALSVMYVR